MTTSAEPSTPSGSSATQQRRRQITSYKNTTSSPATDSLARRRPHCVPRDPGQPPKRELNSERASSLGMPPCIFTAIDAPAFDDQMDHARHAAENRDARRSCQCKLPDVRGNISCDESCGEDERGQRNDA